MTPRKLHPLEERVLVLTPTGADARVACDLLGKAGMQVESCGDFAELLENYSRGSAGCLFIAQEALAPDSVQQLTEVLGAQEAWSDIPLILLSTQRMAVEADSGALASLTEVGNILIVERPCRAGTLINMARTALRARRR